MSRQGRQASGEPGQEAVKEPGGHLGQQRRPNRLIHETSPYLQQHAYNPVDWYPWGPEALEKARRENKPILLSIGYSACHWCHVMERECFEDPQIAELMNRYFVNIKVDREERPDLDHIYQLAAQMFTGQGGWPLTVFLTPDLRPFFAGTYFPPRDRYGRPGFLRVLETLHRVVQQEPERVEQAARQIMEALQDAQENGSSGSEVPSPQELEGAAARLMAQADRAWGGFGDAPKFPHAFALEFLLRTYLRTGERPLLEHALFSLRRMALGGLYDQLGGGFHRYSVDPYWSVPHFEKMLYDNAVLPPVYLQAYQLTNDPLFARVARETLDYVLREMTHAEGGFFSTQDADSEGVEGKFFVWTPQQVHRVLGSEDAALVLDHFGISPQGNFEDHTTVLHVAVEPETLAAKYGLGMEEVEERLKRARQALFAAREERVKPFRDEKVITGWNALMISALARAAQVLEEGEYLSAAHRALAFIDAYLTEPAGAGGQRLLRSFKERPAPIPGYLEDYVFLAQALVDLYETDFHPAHLRRAESLMDQVLALFWDDARGGLFLTSADHEGLIQRPKEAWDQSVPSGNGVAAQVLLRLYSYTGEDRWRQKAEAIFKAFGSSMIRHPLGFGSLLCALDRYHGVVKEIVVAGGSQSLLQRIQRVYLPNRALVSIQEAADYPPLARGKWPKDGQAPAIYVCRDFQCRAPVNSWEELEPLLKS